MTATPYEQVLHNFVTSLLLLLLSKPKPCSDWLRRYKATADTLVCTLTYLVRFLRCESLGWLSDTILTPLLGRPLRSNSVPTIVMCTHVKCESEINNNPSFYFHVFTQIWRDLFWIMCGWLLNIEALLGVKPVWLHGLKSKWRPIKPKFVPSPTDIEYLFASHMLVWMPIL